MIDTYYPVDNLPKNTAFSATDYVNGVTVYITQIDAQYYVHTRSQDNGPSSHFTFGYTPLHEAITFAVSLINPEY